jgi:hypothetical protein
LATALLLYAENTLLSDSKFQGRLNIAMVQLTECMMHRFLREQWMNIYGGRNGINGSTVKEEWFLSLKCWLPRARSILDAYKNCRIEALEKFFPMLDGDVIEILIRDNYLQKKDIKKFLYNKV